MNNIIFKIKSFSCISCLDKLENKIIKIDNVESVNINIISSKINVKLKNEEKAKTLAIIEENPDENPITSNRDGKNNHYRDLLNNKEFVLSVLCPQNVLKLLQIITLEFNLHPISNVESFQSFHDLTKYLF